MVSTKLLASLALALSLVACGGGGDAPAEPGAVTFAFRLRGLPGSEEFRVSTTSPSLISQARAQLQLPESQRMLFVSGTIQLGSGGHNLGWGWHFTQAELVEAATEVCDGRPSLVQADLGYWLGVVQRFCPWGSYVYAEIP
ncbi:MAG: hypothetical protein Q8R01_03030 [Ramlibacter sp.]|nr:hypothetical protein [Ramlibacter sp.]